MRKSRPEPPLRAPISFRAGSNGELVPAPPDDRDRRASAQFRRLADDGARRLGLSRREFLDRSCASAAALLVINQAYGCGGDGGGGGGGAPDGGRFAVDARMVLDDARACAALSGDEFIFDVQSHHVDPTGTWRDQPQYWELFLASQPQGGCGEADPVTCYSREHYIREMFINSDTAVAVLSAVPAVEAANPLTADEQASTRAVVDQLAGSPRLITHGLVLPDRGPAQLDGMQRLAEELGISAWKVYTPYGDWRLDDEAVGIPFIERARALGIKRICAHKGLPLPGFNPAFAAPDDIGVVAAAYPDVTFLVYHSAYETETVEGPYDGAAPAGVDRLIKTLADHGIGPGGNVYAELGSTWRSLMTRPDQAAHVMGKLLVALGEDRILWGTDSIWYGSPQEQIAAFRTFEITDAFQETFGYPALTAAAKAKILGLNAAAAYGVDPDAVRCAIDGDDLSAARRAVRDRELPRFALPPLGPRSRRELLAFLRARSGEPG